MGAARDQQPGGSGRRRWATLALLLSVACGRPAHHDAARASEAPPAVSAAVTSSTPRADSPDGQAACRARIEAVLGAPSPADTVGEDERVVLLGRAAGEPVVFVRTPRSRDDAGLRRDLREVRERVAGFAHPEVRLRALVGRLRHEPAALRALTLREGYLYSDDPAEALALVKELTLGDLFDQPNIWLQRGTQTHRLRRDDGRRRAYVHESGLWAGQAAHLLLFDRVAATEEGLAEPLHRDARAFARAEGFERMRVVHRTPGALVAELRWQERWVRAMLRSVGAGLRLECLDAPVEEVAAVRGWQRDSAWRRRALGRLHDAVDRMIAERMPFDRPQGAEDHLSDGQLRPRWEWSYRQGRRFFSHEQKGYAIFGDDGVPRPPQMCVELILDSYERAAGTWYLPLGQEPRRTGGALDFNTLGIGNRAGVLAFELFAREHEELFIASRFAGAERIPFRERQRFFEFLREQADRFAPGDIVAIQGLKRDGYVHQHAILVEDVDPLTGFPQLLADQMKWPRRRTWEGIMAEAPARSLLYHLRPTDDLLRKLDRD